MKDNTSRFLNLLFNRGEEICVSPNKYGYHSIPQDSIGDAIELTSPNEKYGKVQISESDINLIAVNPIKGFRTDSNVTAFRSFMVEIDNGELPAQKEYIDKAGLPYSACVFSGNKSLHFVVVLKDAFPHIDIWRFYNQWILNVLSETDQQIKNPSRSIRFPDNKRHDGKQLIQSLVSLKDRISQEDLFRWLYSHEDKQPIQRVTRDYANSTNIADITKIPAKITRLLDAGISDSRNATWFYVGCVFASRGFDLPSTMDYLNQRFQEDSDFRRREWESCLKSAFKRINGDQNV